MLLLSSRKVALLGPCLWLLFICLLFSYLLSTRWSVENNGTGLDKRLIVFIVARRGGSDYNNNNFVFTIFDKNEEGLATYAYVGFAGNF